MAFAHSLFSSLAESFPDGVDGTYGQGVPRRAGGQRERGRAAGAWRGRDVPRPRRSGLPGTDTPSLRRARRACSDLSGILNGERQISILTSAARAVSARQPWPSRGTACQTLNRLLCQSPFYVCVWLLFPNQTLEIH